MVPQLSLLTSEVLDQTSLAKFRKAYEASAARPLASPVWFEQRVPAAPGAPPVRICIINARPDVSLPPVLVHMHGGRFVVGSADSAINMLQQIALELDCLIVTVDYRLAPETPFPGPLEDNYAALKWVHGNAIGLGGDPARIAVIGQSAGGGHAAMLAIAARDRGEVPIAYQALIYPMLDDRTGSTRSVPPHMGALIWTAAYNRFGWSALLGRSSGSARSPATKCPRAFRTSADCRQPSSESAPWICSLTKTSTMPGA